MMKVIPLALALLFVAATPAHAEQSPQDRVREVLSGLLHGQNPDSIRPSPVEGFYEATYGTRVFYVSGDGRYLFAGELLDLENQVNVTERRLSDVRKGLIDGVDDGSMIVYGDDDETEHTVTVFTDVDCGYCRKLHRGMQEMNDLGIQVRYLAYPRAGVGSASYDKAVSVWCADDRRAAMDLAKTGKQPAPATCDNPVRRHLDLGQKVGVSGTPALVLEDGRLLPGYVPPKRLLQLLGGSS